VLLAGCSTLHLTEEEHCNSRAYLRTPLQEYIKNRFPYGGTIRLGIIPFAAPANYSGGASGGGFWVQPAGEQLAQQLHRELLARQSAVNIIEVVNRSDWPGQEDEFFFGNHRSIALGRDLGYDLILVGVLERARSIDAISAYAKIIEVNGGITVWSGRSEFHSERNSRVFSPPTSWTTTRPVKELNINGLIEGVAACLAKDALHEEPAPEIE
jgi:hypothetical protein